MYIELIQWKRAKESKEEKLVWMKGQERKIKRGEINRRRKRRRRN
jgi:hypothetical protein